MRPLFYYISYNKPGVGTVHSDGCSSFDGAAETRLDRQFCHALLDEFLDNYEKGNVREDTPGEGPIQDGFLLKLCHEPSHI